MKRLYVSGTERIALLKTVSETFDHGAEELHKRLRQRIEKLVAGDYDEAKKFDRVGMGGYGGGFGGGSNEDLRAFLLREREFWTAAIQLLGEDTTTTAESLQILKKFNEAKLDDSKSSIVPEEIEPALDQAIATLSERN